MSTVTIEINSSTVIVNPESPAEIVLELTGGGTLLDAEIVAGLNAAAAPGAENAFATLSDVTAASAAELAAHVAATDPHGDRAFATRLSSLCLPIDVLVTTDGFPAWSVPFVLNAAIGNLFGTLMPWSNSSHLKFVFSYSHDGIIDTAIWAIDPFGSARWYQAFAVVPAAGVTIQLIAAVAGDVLTQYELQYFHIEADDPHGDRANTTSQIGTHAGAVDPHGDRAFASGLAVNYDAAGAASTAVSNHTSATDPHGDRAYADAQIGQHANDSGAHRNYARIFMMGV